MNGGLDIIKVKIRLPPLKSLSQQIQNNFLNPFSLYFTWWSIHHHFWKPKISSNVGQMSPAFLTHPFWLQALPPTDSKLSTYIKNLMMKRYPEQIWSDKRKTQTERQEAQDKCQWGRKRACFASPQAACRLGPIGPAQCYLGEGIGTLHPCEHSHSPLIHLILQIWSSLCLIK